MSENVRFEIFPDAQLNTGIYGGSSFKNARRAFVIRENEDDAKVATQSGTLAA